jgi:hypothetical protein
MREEKRVPEQDDSIQGRGSENARYKNESLEGGGIYGAEGGLRMDMFEHDDPEEDLQCICDLPEHSQNLIVEDFVAEEDA